LELSQPRTGEIVAGIGGVALFVFLFFDWFGGGAEVSGNVLNGTATISHPGISGWDALTDLPGFLIIFTGVVGIKFAGLFGIFLGLAAVVAIWVGAWLALQEDGWEPLVDVSGSRKK